MRVTHACLRAVQVNYLSHWLLAHELLLAPHQSKVKTATPLLPCRP